MREALPLLINTEGFLIDGKLNVRGANIKNLPHYLFIVVEIDDETRGISDNEIRDKAILKFKEIYYIFSFLNQKEVANKMGKSRPWLCQRLNGHMVNKKSVHFTEKERNQLKNVLQEMAVDIMKTTNHL